MKEKIKNQKLLWIISGIFVLIIIIVIASGGEKTSQQAQVSRPTQQETEKQTTPPVQGKEQAAEEMTEEKAIGEITEGEKTEEEEKIEIKQEKLVPPEVSVTTNIIDYVIDGDTVKLRNGEKVRFIGINTPEMGQPYSSGAKNKLKELVEGKEVILEKDITDRDQYGRLLRYIWLGDILINLEMVRLGYANSYTYPPDVKYQDRIVAAEREAREEKIGLWAPAEMSACVIISYMHADAAGNDNYNLNDEYIIFKNICSQDFNMSNWTVKDEATHIFTFPSFYFAPQATITLYSGSGTNTTDKFYWNRTDERYAIWNNTGDTIYLRDDSGDLVLEYSY